ncbi:MAG: hypothetical protein HY268_32810, partial [Deltaproteobacteria bacterium]|nr:hypothetical protein [Deltaproteobacteria bacterium]
PTGRHVTYEYDPLYRLTREQISSSAGALRTISYIYDAVGNRLSRTDSGEGQPAYEYDANDRLVRETLGGNETVYSYDNNGNRLSRVRSATDRTFYDWDFENRLTAVTTTDGTGTHQTT